MNIIEVINKYIKIYDIERTGWKIRGINSPETVAEHVLSCILLCFALLPDNCASTDCNELINDYDKNLILLLLLIHDLGEIDIGDKKRGTKTDREKTIEHQSIQNFLNAVKFNNPNCNLYDCLDKLWFDMESGNPKNINAKIAKEIDYIQGAYQYFLYCISGKVKFTKETCQEWLNEVSDDKIQTSQGKKIRDNLILKNADFLGHKRLSKYFSNFKL